MVIVQLVEVIWTKASRGAPASNIRNSVPKAKSLLPGVGKYVYQHQLFRENDGFAGQLSEARVSNIVLHTEGELRLYPEKNFLKLGLSYSGKTGKPIRNATNNALFIEGEQFARLVTNGRHASYSGQWYRQATYNVGLTDEMHPNLFVGRKPDKFFSLEADLF